ncbi:adenylate cyclase [Burkholderia pseudomallei]|uniref:zinc ribbon domain-containing protein n=1 Tax=Burkholderia pseudomallei TaxID=28450 RepID=UPI00097711FD|nr:zinc ribbon domain-containing protein [Burkholderia pseudomallei]ONC34477.1 adenylate cyclase [Burkholderia pseudomallei]
MDWFKWLAGGRHRGYGGRGHHGGEAGGGHGHGGGHGERGDHGSHGWGRQGVQRGGGWNDARDGAPLRGEAGAPAQHAACAKCGAINGAEAKFCAQCGASQTPPVCGACRAPLAASARFCPQCGTAVSAQRG